LPIGDNFTRIAAEIRLIDIKINVLSFLFPFFKFCRCWIAGMERLILLYGRDQRSPLIALKGEAKEGINFDMH
jgi:hypothetical protein